MSSASEVGRSAIQRRVKTGTYSEEPELSVSRLPLLEAYHPLQAGALPLSAYLFQRMLH